MSSQGKNVLITGVAGIGGGLVKKCVEEGASTIFCVDREEQYLKPLVADSTKIVKILADVGTQEGVKKIQTSVGNEKLDWIILCAAASTNQGSDSKYGGGAALLDLKRDELQDMIQTDVYGKLFLIQAVQSNIQKSEKKCRILNLGAPFGDGPKPDGTFMAIPSWCGFGIAKTANRYLWEGLKVECKDLNALFGYGHPGLTKTSLTSDVYENYKFNGPKEENKNMMKAMVTKRFDSEDYHTVNETALLFYTCLSSTSDDDFEKKTWGIQNLKDLGCDVKEISDMKAGIQIPQK